MKKISLKAVSYLSPNLFWFYQEVSDAITRQCKCDLKLVPANCDPLDDPLLQQDQVDVAFICGLPLIRHNRLSTQPLQILAAPVMLGDRYRNQPIYFSDLVVRVNSLYQSLEDLQGSRFCYNDIGSNSGYNLLRYRLLQYFQAHGRDPNQMQFFHSVQPSGSHQRSLQWIATGLADCAAIDSVVMEAEIRQSPELATNLKVIESMPSPIPPIAVSAHVEAELIQHMRTALLEPDAKLQAAMQLAQVSHYVQVALTDYHEIGAAYDAAIKAGYEAIA